MTCFFCASEMLETTTTYFQEVGGTMVIIKNVPCFRCKKCGETAYTATVVGRLEEIIDQLRESLQEVNVVNYTAA